MSLKTISNQRIFCLQVCYYNRTTFNLACQVKLIKKFTKLNKFNMFQVPYLEAISPTGSANNTLSRDKKKSIDDEMEEREVSLKLCCVLL